MLLRHKLASYHHYLKSFKKLFHFPKTPFLTYLIVIHTYFIIEFYIPQSFYPFLSFPTVLYELISVSFGYLTLITLYYFLETLFSSLRWFKFIALMILLCCYGFSASYFFGTSHYPEFGLLYETIHDVTALGVFDVINNRLDHWVLVLMGVSILIFFILECYKQTISLCRIQLSHYRYQTCLLCVVYLFLIVLPFSTIDLVTQFFKSTYTYFFNPIYPSFSISANEYPYSQSHFVYSSPPSSTKQARPHVFLIVLESFNESAVSLKNSKNQLIMPYFNKLISQGLYIEHYYSPSILSIKGYGSLFTGILPAIRGILLRSNLNKLGLGEIFKHNGYETGAFLSESSNNLKPIFHKLGFNDFQQLNSFVKPLDKHFWKSSWGYEDRVLYHHFFNYLDQKHALNDDNKPFFYTLITLYNHCGFDVPKHRRLHYKNPKHNLKKNYANSIALSDEGLFHFFNELKKRPYLQNSLIIITGDHGYPLGHHGITSTEHGIYDESYRVPFLMIWPGILSPKRIPASKGVYSHVDVAPSLVDLLYLHVPQHHFIGSSIFSDQKKPTLLVQPYSGIYLQVINYPYKYVRHLTMQKEYVYNLKKDPLETTNIINSLTLPYLSDFRQTLSQFFLNQYLIDTNHIFRPQSLKVD